VAIDVREVLASVRSLLGGGAAFIIGNSLLGIALPLRMEAAGYPVGLIGILMTAYYAGLAVGSLYGKRIILRVGHIRAFAVFAAVAAATALAYPIAFTDGKTRRCVICAQDGQSRLREQGRCRLKRGTRCIRKVRSDQNGTVHAANAPFHDENRTGTLSQHIFQSETGDTVLHCGVDKIGALGNTHVRHV
jgi:hypothetical protein